MGLRRVMDRATLSVHVGALQGEPMLYNVKDTLLGQDFLTLVSPDFPVPPRCHAKLCIGQEIMRLDAYLQQQGPRDNSVVNYILSRHGFSWREHFDDRCPR